MYPQYFVLLLLPSRVGAFVWCRYNRFPMIILIKKPGADFSSVKRQLKKDQQYIQNVSKIWHCDDGKWSEDVYILYVTWSRGMSRMSLILFLRYWQKQFSNFFVLYSEPCLETNNWELYQFDWAKYYWING